MTQSYETALKSFCESREFEKALVENSVTAWSRSNAIQPRGMEIDIPDGAGIYRLALFLDGTWKLLPEFNPPSISSQAIVLSFPFLDESSLNNYMNHSNDTERTFFRRRFSEDKKNIEKILIEELLKMMK